MLLFIYFNFLFLLFWQNNDCAYVFISFKHGRHKEIKILIHRIYTLFDKMRKFPDLENFDRGKNIIFAIGLIEDPF